MVGATCLGQEIDLGQPPHQHGGRAAIQIAEAPPHGAGPYPCAVPGEVVTAVRLPDGRAELFKARSELAKALGLGQTRKGKKAGKKRAA